MGQHKKADFNLIIIVFKTVRSLAFRIIYLDLTDTYRISYFYEINNSHSYHCSILPLNSSFRPKAQCHFNPY